MVMHQLELRALHLYQTNINQMNAPQGQISADRTLEQIRKMRRGITES